MKTWIDSDLQLRRQMIANIADEQNLQSVTIEKDWWVTMTLKALFETSCREYLSFKGGTSLSKGWNLIDRFSEDIDLSLHHSFFGIESTTKSQREKLRKQSRLYIVNELSKELEERLHGFGITDVKVVPVTKTEGNNPHAIDSDKDPVVLRIQYQSVLPMGSGYMLPFVKVEISCLSMNEPTEMVELSSIIRGTYPKYDEDAIVAARTVRPTRTFLEKAFLLCEEFQKDKPRTQRMTRHFYDMYKLAQTPFVNEALQDVALYRRIVEHRESYYHVHYVDYSRLLPENISFFPPDSLSQDYKADYQMMLQEYIYDPAAPSFEDLMQFLMELQDRFRNIRNYKYINNQWQNAGKPDYAKKQ